MMSIVATEIRPVCVDLNFQVYELKSTKEKRYQTYVVRDGKLFSNATVEVENRLNDSVFTTFCRIFSDPVDMQKWWCGNSSTGERRFIWVQKKSLQDGIDILPKKLFPARIPFYKDSQGNIHLMEGTSFHNILQELQQHFENEHNILPFFIRKNNEIAFRPVKVESIFSLHFEREVRQAVFLIQKLILEKKISQEEAEIFYKLFNPVISHFNEYAQNCGMRQFYIHPIQEKTLQDIAQQEPYIWHNISTFLHSDENYSESVVSTFCKENDNNKYLFLHYGFLPPKLLLKNVISPILNKATCEEEDRVPFRYCYALDLAKWMKLPSISWDFEKFKGVIQQYKPSFSKLVLQFVGEPGHPPVRDTSIPGRIPSIFQSLDFILHLYRNKISALEFHDFELTELAFSLQNKGPLRLLFSEKNPYPLQQFYIRMCHVGEGDVQKVRIAGLQALSISITLFNGESLSNDSFHSVKKLDVSMTSNLSAELLKQYLPSFSSLEAINASVSNVQGSFLTPELLKRIQRLSIVACKNIDISELSLNEYPNLEATHQFNSSGTEELAYTLKDLFMRYKMDPVLRFQALAADYDSILYDSEIAENTVENVEAGLEQKQAV